MNLTHSVWLGSMIALLGCSDGGSGKSRAFNPVDGDDEDAARQTSDRDASNSGPGDARPPRDSDAASTRKDSGVDGAVVDGPGGQPVPCGQAGWIAEIEGMRFAGACEGSSLTLLPVAQVGGVWYGGGRTGDCSVEGTGVVCSAGALGRVGVEVQDGKLRPFLEAKISGELQTLGLEGKLTLPSAKAVLSNGLQSWSQSGVLALGNEPSKAALDTALSARGEDEVYRKGSELSWWYTFVGGGDLSFSAGALSAEKLRSYTQVYKDSGALKVRLMSGAGEKLAVQANERISGEWFRAEVGNDLEAMLGRYGRGLPSRRTQHPVAAPLGWNSWYDLWDDVRADQIVSPAGARNADLAKTLLAPVLPARDAPTWIVIDDGWQKAWGTWETNDKFPDGLAGLAKAIETRGMRMGVWFAPLLVHPDTEVAKQHPEWLVKGATYAHPAHGDMGVLDVTHPDAAAHLTKVVQGFVAAGMGLLKADFLFAGTWEGGRHEPVTGMQAYARALKLMRDAAGQETLLVAVGAPPLVTFEYVDAWRVGNDIAFKPLPVVGLPRPGFSFIANQARQVTSRWPYCLATLCDADPMLLRTLDREQVEAGAWVAAAAGGALFLSDDLTKLTKERRTWGLDAARVSLGLGGVPATPESFFPETIPTELVNMKDGLFSAVHDIPAVWRLPDGKRLAFNFTDASRKIENTTVPAHGVRVLTP